MRILLIGILIVLCFIVCLILAKHGEEEGMVDEHEAIAKLQQTLEERQKEDMSYEETELVIDDMTEGSEETIETTEETIETTEEK